MANVTDAHVKEIVGSFSAPDIQMFRVLLDATAARLGGDLAELGVLWGRSAVLVGSSLQSGETFTVVDLFEDEATDSANAQENESSYPGLTRGRFEDNYRVRHGTLPVIVQGYSRDIVDHASHGTHRFVHVDASHLYDHVAEDIQAAKILLKTDGVIVLDDFRAEHTPGVAAAAWQAVITSGLQPFAVSPYKMYATWGDDDKWRTVLTHWARSTGAPHEQQQVNGRPLLRIMYEIHGRQRLVKHYLPEAAWPLMAKINLAQRRLRSRATKR